MITHAPTNYICPFCLIVEHKNLDSIRTNKEDVFYEDDKITAFVASDRWANNPVNLLIIPNKHFENIYDIPDELLAYIHKFSKKLAIAVKEIYESDGTSLRQHNEPDGNQDVFHYHLHVTPRYKDDKLYLGINRSVSNKEDRAEHARKLRTYFKK